MKHIPGKIYATVADRVRAVCIQYTANVAFTQATVSDGYDGAQDTELRVDFGVISLNVDRMLWPPGSRSLEVLVEETRGGISNTVEAIKPWFMDRPIPI